MFLLYILLISLSIMVSESSSVGSDTESLLTCSKFHFEERVLEKLVRLEHKMEITGEKMKRWEDTFSSKLNKMDAAIKQTEIFVETMRDTDLQEQSRLNGSYQEIVEKYLIRSKNETELNREQIEAMLESLSSNIEERTKILEDTFSSKLNKMDEAMNRTETFVESMRGIYLHDQSQLNYSFQELVENFEIRSKNETDICYQRMNTMFESMSSKTEEVGVAENKRLDTMELMQYTLQQEQKRLNQSFDILLENTKLCSNSTIMELIIAKQKKVAVTACGSSDQTFADGVVRFPVLKFHIGIDNLDTFKSNGKFVCEIPGLYYISAHIYTNSNVTFFYVRKNDGFIASSASTSTSSDNPISAVVELQQKDTLYVYAHGFYIYGAYSCLSIMKIG